MSQVAARNAVSLTQQDHKLQGGVHGIPLEPHVSHVAFSHEGLVMATVNVRPNAGSLGSDEQSLRFWDRREGVVQVDSNQEQPFYSTNTYLDDPHRYKTPTVLLALLQQAKTLATVIINHSTDPVVSQADLSAQASQGYNKVCCNVSAHCILHTVCDTLRCFYLSGMCRKLRLVHESMRNCIIVAGEAQSQVWRITPLATWPQPPAAMATLEYG